MKPVLQTKIGEGGNCLQACLASLLELPLDAVPDFCSSVPKGEDWFIAVAQWLRPHGLGILMMVIPPDMWPAIPWPDCYSIVSGRSPREPKLLHAVIAWGNRIVHDPAGMPPDSCLRNIEDVMFLVPLAPPPEEGGVAQ